MASATLMLHLTGRCNLECRHCYMDGSPRRRERLPLDWILQSLGAAPELGIGSLFLTGGEPLMYPHFPDVVRAAVAVEGLTTTVCTNATLVRPREAELFAGLGVDVHVSVDGEPAFHDAFRCIDNAFRDLLCIRLESIFVRLGPFSQIDSCDPQCLRCLNGFDPKDRARRISSLDAHAQAALRRVCLGQRRPGFGEQCGAHGPFPADAKRGQEAEDQQLPPRLREEREPGEQRIGENSKPERAAAADEISRAAEDGAAHGPPDQERRHDP